MRKNHSEQKYKSIIAFDFDGVINSPNIDWLSIQTGEEQPPNHDYINPKELIFITHKEYFNVCFNILIDNNVLPILGSQRICKDLDNNETNLDKEYHGSMYTALDNVFGGNRNFLTKDNADIISDNINSEQLANTKNPILNNIKEKFQIEENKIFLIDDRSEYEKPAKEEGFQFIFVNRNKTLLTDELDFLAEILLRTVPKVDIKKGILHHAKEESISKNFSFMLNKFDEAEKCLRVLSNSLKIGIQFLEEKNSSLKEKGKSEKSKILENAIGNEFEEDTLINLQKQINDQLISKKPINKLEIKEYCDQFNKIVENKLENPMKSINASRNFISRFKEIVLDRLRNLFGIGHYSTNRTIEKFSRYKNLYIYASNKKLNPSSSKKKASLIPTRTQ